jgi:putative colanic acid biosynthesis acetyltransferase WcaF
MRERNETRYAASRRGPSFSLKNRLARMLWQPLWLLLFRLSPRPFHGWRSLILRCFGAKIGRHVHVYPGVKIWAPWNLTLNDGVGIGDGTNLYSQDAIIVGENAVISQGCHLCTGTHDYNDRGMALVTRPIKIGKESWLAAECFVHPGVIVGDGAVIGARSVVTNNLPPWTICAGHPCIAIKPRRRPLAEE